MKLTSHPTGGWRGPSTPQARWLYHQDPQAVTGGQTHLQSLSCAPRGRGEKEDPSSTPNTHARAHTHTHTFTHASAPSVPTGFETVGKPQGERWAGRKKRWGQGYKAWGWGQGVPCSEVTCKFKLYRKVSKRQDSLCPWQKGWGGQHEMGQRGEASPNSPLMGPSPNP